MATHSSTPAWKIPWMEEPGRLQSMGLLGVGHDWATSLSLFTFMHWRRKWQPTPVFLPGESQGRGSLVGCHLWGRTESDTTEATEQQQQQQSNISKVHLRCTCVQVSLHFKAEGIHYALFLHLSMSGYFHCFQLLAIANNRCTFIWVPAFTSFWMLLKSYVKFKNKIKLKKKKKHKI